MKTLLTLCSLAFLTVSYGNSIDSIEVRSVSKYTEDPDLSLRIPTYFGQPVLITPKVAALIEGQKIHLIELVYTENKEHPDFDQMALNQERIAQLKTALPQITADDPEWSFIQQTGAGSSREAQSYFHGFVIHFGNMTTYADLNAFFEPFQVPFQRFTIDNAKGADISIESGSTLHIPANAVTKDGEPVEGSYTLNYREFRDQSDILFSGIPMQYEEDQEKYQFESYGMYEIRGTQDGVELELEKPVTVDFNCTSTGEGVSFYALDDASETWKKLHEIDFQDTDCATHTNKKDWYWRGRKKEDHALVIFNSAENLAEVADTIAKDPTWGSGDFDVKVDESQLAVVLSPENFDDFMLFLHFCVYPDSKIEIDSETSAMTPTLIPNLKSPGFGVFNCDGMYQEKNPVPISPQYIDLATGELISCPRTTTVINKRINSVRSFHPNRIVCDTQGDLAVVMFTNDGKIYTSEKFDLKRDEGNAEMPIEMKEVTGKIASSEDLTKMLNLKVIKEDESPQY